MRVDDQNLRQIGSQGAEAVERTTIRSGSELKRTASSVRDDVSVSALGEAVQGIQEGSSVREAKVERLRELYLNGNYKVDAEAVANGIVNEALSSEAAPQSSSQ